jgi:prepilin-type processing-associated H-X9-DG protein
MEGAVLAYELPGTHGGKYGNVLFADSGVQTFDAQSLTNLIAELQSGHNPPRPEKLHPATSLPVNDKSNQPGTN